MHRGLADLRDGDRFGGWVYTIAERAVADHLRKRARHPVAGHSENQLEDETAELRDAGSELHADLAECVTLFVSRLASPYRDAITLTELQGLTQKDAGRRLGLSPSGMKSRVQRGRAQIRRMFEECCEISLDARGHVADCTPRPLEGTANDGRALQCRAVPRVP
jgi:RNA polymerase sigma-70 factor (ECF subfamily)